MHRALSASWGLLLAVLLGASSHAGMSFDPPAGGLVLRPATTGTSDAHYLRTVARPHAAVDTRSPPERHSATPGGALQSGAVVALAGSLEPVRRTHGDAPPPGYQARPYPLFPTGPPSHS